MIPSEVGTPPAIVQSTPVPAQVMHSSTLRRLKPSSRSAMSKSPATSLCLRRETDHDDDLFLHDVTSQRCHRRCSELEHAALLLDMNLHSELPVLENYSFPGNLFKLVS